MTIKLTAAARTRLRQAMKQAASARLYRRLQAVFLAGEGHAATQVAAITGASKRRVQGGCATWRRSGERRHPQKALAEKPRLGRRPGVPTLDRARLLDEMIQDPLALGYAATNWTVPLLAAHLQRRCGLTINAPTLRRRLHAAGLRWKRAHALSSSIPPRPSRRKRGARARHEDPAQRGGRLLVLDETTLRHLPPLRAAWALRGQQAQVRLSGKNARRSLFGTLDLRTGRRVLMLRKHQRLADDHAFLRRRRHGVGGCGALWLLLDRHGSHGSPGSLRLAETLGVRLFWLPRQHPKLNPVPG